MAKMKKLNGVVIRQGFAEAFGMVATRLIVTAPTLKWAKVAAEQFCGFATSVIACGCEAAVEGEVKATPDGRAGVSLLLFARSAKEVATQALNRAGQCVMTSPGSALFSGFRGDEKEEMESFALGSALRYFGDGYQITKFINGIRYRRIPVMDGEFLCEDKAFSTKAIAGGNFLIIGTSHKAVLTAAEKAVTAARRGGIIMPFPGGMVRSGSKVGSRYPKLGASTNHQFCPTLKGRVQSDLPPEASAVIEIVINGLSEEAIAKAMRAGILAATKSAGIIAIDAGNYGGKLGKYHFHLHKVLGLDSPSGTGGKTKKPSKAPQSNKPTKPSKPTSNPIGNRNA